MSDIGDASEDNYCSGDDESVSSSEFTHTSHCSATNPQGKQEATAESNLAKQASTAVNRSKVLAYLVLLLAAATVGTVTYLFISDDEEDSFKNQVGFKTHTFYALLLPDNSINSPIGAFFPTDSLIRLLQRLLMCLHPAQKINLAPYAVLVLQ